jgi:hypothetical protein
MVADEGGQCQIPCLALSGPAVGADVKTKTANLVNTSKIAAPSKPA